MVPRLLGRRRVRGVEGEEGRKSEADSPGQRTKSLK
jgi:hypothetical protein